MIALDTNVLVRFLVDDDPSQCRKARDLVRKCVANDTPILIPEVVLCETVWVLRRAYRFGREEIIDVLQKLVSSRGIVLDSPEITADAMEMFRSAKGDLADYLILCRAKAKGALKVATFDKALLGTPGFFTP
ncbi:MAG: type II toxin-antitoxin system VapC family toxin [Myxococcota bacterium]|jgi:predicted nucleic-acid-binding protein